MSWSPTLKRTAAGFNLYIILPFNVLKGDFLEAEESQVI